MGSLNLSLGGAGKGISAEVTFINGSETIREHSFKLLFHCLEGNQGDEDGLLISNDSTGRKEISENLKRCQGRRNCAESNTGATNLKFKENRVD